MRIRTRHYSYRTECCRTASANSFVRSPRENCTIGAPGVWMPDALGRNFLLILTTTWSLGLGGESSVEMADADRLTARDGSGDQPAHGAGGPRSHAPSQRGPATGTGIRCPASGTT